MCARLWGPACFASGCSRQSGSQMMQHCWRGTILCGSAGVQVAAGRHNAVEAVTAFVTSLAFDLTAEQLVQPPKPGSRPARCRAIARSGPAPQRRRAQRKCWRRSPTWSAAGRRPATLGWTPPPRRCPQSWRPCSSCCSARRRACMGRAWSVSTGRQLVYRVEFSQCPPGVDAPDPRRLVHAIRHASNGHTHISHVAKPEEGNCSKNGGP